MELRDAPYEVRIQVVPVEGDKYLAVLCVSQIGVLTGTGMTPVQAIHSRTGRLLWVEETRDDKAKLF